MTGGERARSNPERKFNGAAACYLRVDKSKGQLFATIRHPTRGTAQETTARAAWMRKKEFAGLQGGRKKPRFILALIELTNYSGQRKKPTIYAHAKMESAFTL